MFGNSKHFIRASLLVGTFFLICVLVSTASIAFAQMHEEDGRELNSAGGNVWGDSSINPMADPDINLMADPDINPMGDAYMRDDGTMGLRSEDE